MIHLSPEDRTVYARAIAVGAAGEFEWPSKQERGLMMTAGRATAGGVVNDDGTMAHELAHERRMRNLLAIAKVEAAGSWRQMPSASSFTVHVHVPTSAASSSLQHSQSSHAILSRPATANAAAGSGTGGRLSPNPEARSNPSPFVLGSTYCSYSMTSTQLPRPSTASGGAGRTAIVSTTHTRRPTSPWHMSTYVPSINVPRGGSAGQRVPAVKGTRSAMARPGSAIP